MVKGQRGARRVVIDKHNLTAQTARRGRPEFELALALQGALNLGPDPEQLRLHDGSAVTTL